MSNSPTTSTQTTMDPLVREKLVAKFNRAVEYITTNPASDKVTPQLQLTFYSLFKQATVGPNRTPAPSRVRMVDRLKWQAWKDLKNLSSEKAMIRYLNRLKEEDPEWKEKSKQPIKVHLRSKL